MQNPFMKNLRNKKNILIFLPIIVITVFILGLQVGSESSDVSTYTVTSGVFTIDIHERGRP